MSRQQNLKILAAVLVTASTALTSLAGFDQFGDPSGAMNVYNNVNGSQGDWLWYSGWGLADLQALTTDNRTFELLPNINCYNDTDAYWSDGNGDGNKFMDATTLFEMTIQSGQSKAMFTFDVDAFDLDPRYELVGFIKVLDPNNNYQPVFENYETVTNTGSIVISNSFSAAYSGMALQAGWMMSGLNANPADDWGSATVTATFLGVDSDDQDPPTPNPMTFASAPHAVSDSAISMTATTATDDSTVEYYFTCTSGAGHDSGWQSGTTYVDSGLAPNTAYAYTVTARDTSFSYNETAPSAAASATTQGADNEAPTPNPMTIADTDPSPVSIMLTATTATDDSDVEYYFTCTAGAGHDSGWQSSPVYVDTGLVPASNYTYTVTARDLSALTNTTAASSPVLVSTLANPGSGSITNSLTELSGASSSGQTLHELAKAGFEMADVTTAGKVVTFGPNGVTYNPSATWQSRNVLRTIGSDYGDGDFEVYATVIIQGTTEQASFIGVGQGLIGGWGVPDFELAGVNAINAEVQYNWCKMWTWLDGTAAVTAESAGISSVTNRLRMVHDATAQTITVEVDTDYIIGEAFVADRVLATNSTVGVWADMPQRIYMGAGAGVVVRDLQITASTVAPPVVPVTDLAIAPVTGGVELQWTGVAGQVYSLQYKTDLTAETWTADPSSGASDITATVDGPLSATSTVDEPAAFYTVVTE
ncbi:MAG: hypothetical protein JXR25_14340 [Pontiellaceae bacterium]|nr:hypothetical protein [Pontiellaceae bacterium]MBN2785998.1 hypothetical protein [Pontiellaceae bacterium]